MAYVEQYPVPVVANHIESQGENLNAPSVLIFATRNQDKLQEIGAVLEAITIVGKDLNVKEIQSEDPLEVLKAKAIEAWRKNKGMPIVVEDSSLTVPYLSDLPGPFADQFTNTRQKRKHLLRMLKGKTGEDRAATFKVGLAVFDGEKVQYHIGEVTGRIAKKPRGINGFGFDDIFIPDGQTDIHGEPISKKERKTYAQMTREEKIRLSPRTQAVQKLLRKPFELGRNVYQLPEPARAEMQAIRYEELLPELSDTETSNTQTEQEFNYEAAAKRFAYGLESFTRLQADEEPTVLKINRVQQIGEPDSDVLQYRTTDEDSASQGIVLYPSIDLKTDLDGNPTRLARDAAGNPILMQMGQDDREKAIAARLTEFNQMHNPQMHKHIRDLMNGTIKHVPRSNTRSKVLEQMMMMEKEEIVPEHNVAKRIWNKITRSNMVMRAKAAIATKELGYKRLFTPEKMSRKESANTGLIIMSGDIPSSIFSLGGMPPVTGSRDVLVTSALSYMRSWIPRNGVFAGDFERQLKLFEQARDQIRSIGLPEDITEICIKQIGLSVGCDNPAQIAEEVKRFQEAGGHSVRIYTTAPDVSVLNTAKAIREAAGDDLMICVGPVTDYEQAKALKKEANVRMFLAGHGGGENCTSLAGGGTANSLEILYQMYMDPEFNDCIIGLEGGTGNYIGGLLGLLDVISLNKRGVNGGIELTGGLFLKSKKKEPVLPYHGSASVPTQKIEARRTIFIARRREDPDGKIRNVEGKPNYMRREDWVHSVVDRFRQNRVYAGTALADQRSRNIYDLRRNIKNNGTHNHVRVSAASSDVAGEHRVAA